MTKLRREAIRELLKIKPFLSYEELGALFPDVSEMTLRRDIEYFENSGEAIKVRGGARSARFITSSTDEAMSARMNSNVLPKERIAQCAAQLLETDRSIFLDSGSTVQSMASFVPAGRFTFTTTNPALALELCRSGQSTVNIVGGRLDRDYQSVSGDEVSCRCEHRCRVPVAVGAVGAIRLHRRELRGMRAEALCGGEGEPGHHADGFIEDRAQSAVHLLHACGGERTHHRPSAFGGARRAGAVSRRARDMHGCAVSGKTVYK